MGNGSVRGPSGLEPVAVPLPDQKATVAAEVAPPTDTQPDMAPESEIRKRWAEAGMDASAIKAQLDVAWMQSDSFKPTNMDGTSRTTPAVVQSSNIEGSPEFQALPQTVRSQLAQEVASNPKVAMQLNQLVQQPLYDQLSTEQGTKLLNVFATANNGDSNKGIADGREELVNLMSRRLNSGQPALLSIDNSPDHKTLLDNLNEVATEDLTHSAKGRRSEILNDVIAETAQPTWHLDQGLVGTCAPTTLQTHLIINNPSEYARLVGGLMEVGRHVKMANGDDLIPAENDLDVPAMVKPEGGQSTADTRSLTERVFQSALAQQAYFMSDSEHKIVNANGDIPGLYPKETANAMSALYGLDYRIAYFPPQVNTMWGTPMGAGMPDVQMDRLKQELKDGHGPVPVSLQWGDGSHQLLVDKIEKDANGDVKVYLRNPWGSRDASWRVPNVPYAGGQTFGTKDNYTNQGPLRTVADPQSGLEVMDMADFRKALQSAILER